ncbi:hypothetical protein TL16_g06315 [Triparma laevis f. inornata]|uniref:Uncharacterized protein n=1 Tax=Triparma laevis f. inornata TaxID=1714386 RepID=A0A9W7ATZ0_9STRA|nr:hypothetical protein TL16_g06315 [Triparma laevis f. inornata]
MTDPFGVLPDPNDDTPKYRPSLNPDDPIVSSLQKALKSSRVKSFELIDSRWNGNEVMKYECEDDKVYFVKMNRVEDPSVFVSEGVSLSALAKTKTIKTPIPLHIGKVRRRLTVSERIDEQGNAIFEGVILRSEDVQADAESLRFGFSSLRSSLSSLRSTLGMR